MLSGMDDGHPFAVEVPLRILSIPDALAWLRPDGVPADAIRQGEWYFLPADDPGEPQGWEVESTTEAGSIRERRVIEIETFDRRGRHMPAACRVVEERGETAFIGRREVKTHSWHGRPRIYVRGEVWHGRPRIYVRGEVTHPEHGTLHLGGGGWYEVVPNRAHGPWAVGQLAGGLD